MRPYIPVPDRLAHSPAEAAAQLGVSRQFIYTLIRQGRLRTVTLGTRRLIPHSVLLELLEEDAVAS